MLGTRDCPPCLGDCRTMSGISIHMAKFVPKSFERTRGKTDMYKSARLLKQQALGVGCFFCSNYIIIVHTLFLNTFASSWRFVISVLGGPSKGFRAFLRAQEWRTVMEQSRRQLCILRRAALLSCVRKTFLTFPGLATTRPCSENTTCLS